jgi:hypothetical protein
MEIVQPTTPMLEAMKIGDKDEFDRLWNEVCDELELGDARETAMGHALNFLFDGKISLAEFERCFGAITPYSLKEGTRSHIDLEIDL